MKTGRFFMVVFSVVILCAFSWCTYRVTQIEREFELVSDDALESDVIQKLGTPDAVDTFATPFHRYASAGCDTPCVRRLWWEHPILKGFEAWSVELSSTGTVLKKSHWVSP
jgi:hypothetical protein